MELVRTMADFYSVSREDPRISPLHISLYMALLELCAQREGKNPISVFSREVMPLAKISGVATYHRTIRELDKFGYISYEASFNHFQGSQIHLCDIGKWKTTGLRCNGNFNKL